MTRLRVASFPAVHPYLDAVRPPEVEPVGPAPPPDRPWAPHPWWQPDALVAAAPSYDVLHVHFGFDHLSAPALARWLEVVRQRQLPLVLTLHDLRNPHHDDPARHDEHLGLLVPAAAAVLTLTAGAAHAVAARWGRPPAVVPHPSLLTNRPAARPPRSGPPRVGIHLKSLRRNVVHAGDVVAAAHRGARCAGAELIVDVHPDVAARPELVAVRATGCAVRVHERYDDAALVGYLQDLDVSVLPQSFGTHSGWLELCRDLGTRVVAPDCGFYAEQWPAVDGYRNSEAGGLDRDSLAAAVAAAVRAGPLAPADPQWRAEQRAAVRREHLRVYREVTGR